MAWTREEYDLAVVLRAAGATCVEVGRRVGKDAGVVALYLREHPDGFPDRVDPWPPERLERLLDCINKRLSAGQTGQILGCTASAAIGKASRLGLPKFGGGRIGRRHEGVEKMPAPKPRAFRLEPRAVKPPRKTPPPIVAPIEVKPLMLPPPPAVAPSDLPTCRQLGSYMCKWPLGNVARGCGDQQRFCGRPADGNYCMAHERMSRRAA